ncbi:MAG: hypothetical protein JWQ44_1462 [Chthoniobacter sp.]|nr:hypothetical protein [Chthoniobacter sp.]
MDAHDGDIVFPEVFPVGQTGLLPDTETDPTKDGEVGPLLPMHTMSVHNTLVWKRGAQKPGMLMFHRHSAYRADEVANPDVIHFLIDNPNPSTGLTAFSSAANQFNSSMRRSFQQFAYGGYNIIHDVSQSVPTRIRVDQTREMTQLWDMNHPAAFKYNFGAPIHSAALLDNSDAEVNLPAFKDMGFSKGLNYDMYCPGFATLEDGRAVFAGGHDLNSQNGMYRIQIFDADLESWAPRPVSCMRDLFGSDPADPYFENYYQAEIQRLAAAGLPASDIFKFYLPDCDPHVLLPTTPEFPHYSQTPGYEAIRLMGANGTVTQPTRIPSDMRYARWYPGQVALPGNRLLVYSGWDRDESKYPEEPTTGNPTPTTLAMKPFIDAKAQNPELYPDLPPTAHLAGFMKGNGDTAFLNSRVKQPVPEVYNGTLDTMTALENARLFTGAWYPNGLVVQTGVGRDDWKVGINDGKLLEDVPNGVTDSAIRDNGYHNMWLLDVQGALKDPDVNTPQVREGKYLTFLSNAANSHTSFTGNSNLMKLDKLGKVISHTLTHFGGQIAGDGTANTPTSDQIEQIRFEGLSKVVSKKDPTPGVAPAWTVSTAKLYQPGRQNYATPLPDGTTVLLGGNGGNRGTRAGVGLIENHSLHLQHFIPKDSDSPLAMPAMDMCNMLAKSLIPRDEHGIIQLMPDGTVYLGGQNRNGLVRAGDPAAPLGDSDLGVPCGQIFTPPYLFDPASGQPAERPVIVTGPETVTYGKPFAVKAFSKKGIKAVTLIRTGSMSHSLNTDVRYVKVDFKAGKSADGMVSLTVYPPKMPATAVGGYYYLFILDNAGVPSIAKVTAVGAEIDKRIKALKKAKLLTVAAR